MKLYTIFLILFLILSIKTKKNLDSFSINSFIDYLKGNGLLEIIQSIKEAYGQDVAIISCEELNEKCKGNCKRLITDYMAPLDLKGRSTSTPVHGKPGDKALVEPHKQEEENLKCINILNHSQFIKHSNLHSGIKRKLKRKFSEKQSNYIYNKIIKRIRDLGPCAKK